MTDMTIDHHLWIVSYECQLKILKYNCCSTDFAAVLLVGVSYGDLVKM